MTNIDTQIIFDKNGNPIPQYLDVADKTGGSAGTMKPITGQNGAQFTQLTGSNVAQRKNEIVFEREVRRESTSYRILRSPKEYSGLIVTAIVRGVTGTFTSDQGLRLDCYVRSANTSTYGLVTERKDDKTTHQIILYPSVDFGNASTYISTVKVASLPIIDDVIIRLNITGTMSEAEGFDSEVHLTWVR